MDSTKPDQQLCRLGYVHNSSTITCLMNVRDPHEQLISGFEDLKHFIKQRTVFGIWTVPCLVSCCADMSLPTP